MPVTVSEISNELNVRRVENSRLGINNEGLQISFKKAQTKIDNLTDQVEAHKKEF